MLDRPRDPRHDRRGRKGLLIRSRALQACPGTAKPLPLMPKVVRCSAGSSCSAAHIHARACDQRGPGPLASDPFWLRADRRLGAGGRRLVPPYTSGQIRPVMRAIRLSNDPIWAAGTRRRRIRLLRSQAVVAEGVLNALSPGGSRALVDAEGLPQVGGGLAGVAVLEVGPAESFQGACLLEGHADVPRDRERLGVALAGLVDG